MRPAVLEKSTVCEPLAGMLDDGCGVLYNRDDGSRKELPEQERNPADLYEGAAS